jgi:hypothetical protein
MFTSKLFVFFHYLWCGDSGRRVKQEGDTGSVYGIGVLFFFCLHRNPGYIKMNNVVDKPGSRKLLQVMTHLALTDYYKSIRTKRITQGKGTTKGNQNPGNSAPAKGAVT